MKAKKRRPIKWIILLLVLGVLAVGMLMPKDEGAVYSQMQVTRGDIRTTYSFTGSLAAPRSQTIAAMTPGRIKSVYAEANQSVKEGDKLLALSSGEVIRAEIDGEVISLNVSEDDPVAVGDVLAMVMDVERMEAEILVDEYDVDAIELGREVKVTINALGAECTGFIKSFTKMAVSMGTTAAYKANVQLDAPEKALPGMQVEVKMLNQSAEGTLLLKVEALQFDEENKVYVMTKDEEGEYAATYIETGINDGTNVQILSGLEEGETVYYSAGLDMMALMREMRGRMK